MTEKRKGAKKDTFIQAWTKKYNYKVGYRLTMKYAKYIKLTNYPIFKQLHKRFSPLEELEKQTGTPIPINVSLNVQNEILPFKVTEYFIEKAGTILLMDCPCRTANKCENHEHSLGCTWLGRGAGKIDRSKWPNARLATKEEALERERQAYENGLVPHLGKLQGDAEVYDVLDYEDEFMSICHCCPCCCIVSIAKYQPDLYFDVIKRMEGVEVRVDPDKCEGCGKCSEVCIYKGLEMKDDKATINSKYCKGCGRCERVCANNAISITIEDYSRIDELIARYESKVDITN